MYQDISFPALGLSFNPSRVAFSIGGKHFYWYGVIIAVGFLLAVLYAARRCKQFGITQDQLIDMLICAVPSAIVCARLYYCVFQWNLYRDDPVRVLFIWEGGLAIYGGVIGAVLAVVAYNQPVTRSFIEQVRGVDSSSVVASLEEKGLIEEAGRMELPGRPVAFRTTAAFLRCFGLSDLSELPELQPPEEAEETEEEEQLGFDDLTPEEEK